MALALHQRNARAHALFRSADRCGLALSGLSIDHHERLIREGRTRYLGKGSAGRELHGVRDLGRVFYAVFCPRLDRIVTYLGDIKAWRGSFAYQGAERGLEVRT